MKFLRIWSTLNYFWKTVVFIREATLNLMNLKVLVFYSHRSHLKNWLEKKGQYLHKFNNYSWGVLDIIIIKLSNCPLKQHHKCFILWRPQINTGNELTWPTDGEWVGTWGHWPHHPSFKNDQLRQSGAW